MPEVYVGLIDVPSDRLPKLSGKHRVTVDDVEEAVSRAFRVVWHDDEKHGRRLLVSGRTDAGRLLKIVLDPVDEAEGTFEVRTVFAP